MIERVTVIVDRSTGEVIINSDLDKATVVRALTDAMQQAMLEREFHELASPGDRIVQAIQYNQTLGLDPIDDFPKMQSILDEGLSIHEAVPEYHLR